MQFIWFLTDHESCAFRERNIILWISHLHVLCLEVPVHHETMHEEDFARVICRQLWGANIYWHTYFRTLSNFLGGWFQVGHTKHRIRPLILASVPHVCHTLSQIASGKWALSTVGRLSAAPDIDSEYASQSTFRRDTVSSHWHSIWKLIVRESP